MRLTMKIINRQQFLEITVGTVYAKYEPCIFGDLLIKCKSEGMENDWFYTEIADAIYCNDSIEMFEKLESSRIKGVSLPMDFDIMTRDGCFDKDQLFAVFEVADVVALIYRLGKALEGGGR